MSEPVELIVRERPGQRISDEAADQMAALYASGWSLRRISDRMLWSYGAVHNRLRYRQGLGMRGQGGTRAGRAGLLDSPEVETQRGPMTRMYVEERLSIREIARRYGIGATSVQRRLDHGGVQRRSTGGWRLLRGDAARVVSLVDDQEL